MARCDDLHRRFMVCEAYYVFMLLWSCNGLTDRCHRQGRSITFQLDRMRFKPSPFVSGPEDLESEAADIYDALVHRYHGTVWHGEPS